MIHAAARHAIALLLANGFGMVLRAQTPTGTVAGVVVSQESGMTLPYGVVAVPALGRERFTTVNGSFILDDLPAGPVRLMVRRLGYTPKELTVTVHEGMTDTIRVELARVAVKLAAMEVRAYPECKHPGPPHPGSDSALATVFTQLHMNAVQYRLLARSYPFAYAVASTLGHFAKDGTLGITRRDTIRIDGLPKWKYKPGKIVSRSNIRGHRGELFVNVLTLIDFADSEFIANHCFHNGGLTQTDSATQFRIDFIASSKIRAPDFSGSIYVDTATYQIRKSVLRVVPVPPIRGMTEMEVTTRFDEVLPSIPVIAKVSSLQTFNTELRGVQISSAFDEQRLIQFVFLGPRPGEDKKP